MLHAELPKIISSQNYLFFGVTKEGDKEENKKIYEKSHLHPFP